MADEDDLLATACSSGLRLCAVNVRGLLPLPLPPMPVLPPIPPLAPGALLVALVLVFAPSPAAAADREGDVEKGMVLMVAARVRPSRGFAFRLAWMV